MATAPRSCTTRLPTGSRSVAKSSANAAEITATLLDAGADAAATLHAYGGTPDTLAMLRSSAHPRAAGVAADIERVLKRGRRISPRVGRRRRGQNSGDAGARELF